MSGQLPEETEENHEKFIQDNMPGGYEVVHKTYLSENKAGNKSNTVAFNYESCPYA
jgi:hypothetical protein